MEDYFAILGLSLLLIAVGWIVDFPHRRHLAIVRSLGATATDLMHGEQLPNTFKKGRKYALPIFQERLKTIGELSGNHRVEELYAHVATNLAHRLENAGLGTTKLHIGRGRFVVKTLDGTGNWALGRTIPILAINYWPPDLGPSGNTLHLVVVIQEVGLRRTFSLDAFCRHTMQVRYLAPHRLSWAIFSFIPLLNVLVSVFNVISILKYAWLTVGPSAKSLVAGTASCIRVDFGEAGFEGLQPVALTISNEIYEALSSV